MSPASHLSAASRATRVFSRGLRRTIKVRQPLPRISERAYRIARAVLELTKKNNPVPPVTAARPTRSVTFVLPPVHVGSLGLPQLPINSHECHTHLNTVTYVTKIFSQFGTVLSERPVPDLTDVERIKCARTTVTAKPYNVYFFRYIYNRRYIAIIQDYTRASGEKSRVASVYDCPSEKEDDDRPPYICCDVGGAIDNICAAPDGKSAIVYTTNREFACFLRGSSTPCLIKVDGMRGELGLFADCMFVPGKPFVIALETSRLGLFAIYPDGSCSDSFYPVVSSRPDKSDGVIGHVDVYTNDNEVLLKIYGANGIKIDCTIREVNGKFVLAQNQ